MARALRQGLLRRCPGFGPQQVLLLEEKKESGDTCLDGGLPPIYDMDVKIRYLNIFPAACACAEVGVAGALVAPNHGPSAAADANSRVGIYIF